MVTVMRMKISEYLCVTAAEFCKKLKIERTQMQDEAEVLRREIETLNSSIKYVSDSHSLFQQSSINIAGETTPEATRLLSGLESESAHHSSCTS